VGVLTENAIYEKTHNTNCFSKLILLKFKIKKLVLPTSKYITIIENINKTEPNRV